MILTFMECGGLSGEECQPGMRCASKCLISKKLDVMVRPEQQIKEVYDRLCENGFLSSLHEGRQISVYSLRRREYVNKTLTFWLGKIYAGDILVIREIQKE